MTVRTALGHLVGAGFRWITAIVLLAFIRLKYDVVILGKRRISGQHPSLMVVNHKRHLDSITLISTLFLLAGLRRPNQRLHFALNEVWFSPRKLASFLGWGWPWDRIVSRFSLAPHLRLLNARPISRFVDRRGWSRIQKQLACFSALLDMGCDLLWTPEGGLMTDGRVHPPRAGLHRIVSQAHGQLRLVPVAIGYDVMTTGRQRIFVQLGAEAAVDPHIPRPRFDAEVQDAIVRSLTVHIGHLAAAVIAEWPAGRALTRTELSERLLRSARRLRSRGYDLDPRLHYRWGFQCRLRRLLTYARRNGILWQTGDDWTLGVGLHHPAVRYAFNELEQMNETARR